jgi:hypothetical protein
MTNISTHPDKCIGNVTPDTPKRYMTVVYEIVDEAEWRKTNPLKYEHNGLSAVRVSIDDACELLDEAEAEVERLRDLLEKVLFELEKVPFQTPKLTAFTAHRLADRYREQLNLLTK